MASLVNVVRNLEIDKLKQYLDSFALKEKRLEELTTEKEQLNEKLNLLGVPEKNLGSLDKLLKTNKYKCYLSEKEKYISEKNKIINRIEACSTEIEALNDISENEEDKAKALALIPLLEKAQTIEEIARFTFYGEQEIKNVNQYFLAIFLLAQNLEIIKTEKDIDEIYDSLNLIMLNQKLENLNVESFLKSLKKIQIEIDDGFIQLITMLLNQKSLCTQENLNSAFPILKQLKEDKCVPKNIRVALEILDSAENDERTIHEVGCEILMKEVFYKIKES
ncbi:MAG: hypothetical protein IJB71_02490 [Bacilli bacterium]|nr:hypothetical protein [Bacilli bacterium]